MCDIRLWVVVPAIPQTAEEQFSIAITWSPPKMHCSLFNFCISVLFSDISFKDQYSNDMFVNLIWCPIRSKFKSYSIHEVHDSPIHYTNLQALYIEFVVKLINLSNMTEKFIWVVLVIWSWFGSRRVQHQHHSCSEWSTWKTLHKWTLCRLQGNLRLAQWLSHSTESETSQLSSSPLVGGSSLYESGSKISHCS